MISTLEVATGMHLLHEPSVTIANGTNKVTDLADPRG